MGKDRRVEHAASLLRGLSGAVKEQAARSAMLTEELVEFRLKN
jgi:hypothetical protein